MDARLRTLISHISRNLHRRLSLEELAEAVSLSSSGLEHLVKRETGLSLWGGRSVRLERVKELLAEGVLVKQAARAVGYKSLSHFISDFKRAHGAPPGPRWQKERTRLMNEAKKPA